MKQAIRQCIYAAVLAMCCAVELTSCSEKDNAVAVSDDKPWTVSTDDIDPTVKPGDDFYMYCNGGYWQSTAIREDTAMIVSLLRTVGGDALKKKIVDLTLPSLQILKAHAALPKPTREALEALVAQKLQPLKDAATLEEAWRTTGKLIAEGLTFNFSLHITNIHGTISAVMFPKDMGAYVPNIDMIGKRLNSPDFEGVLMPVGGNGMTRGAGSGEWPMLVAWFEAMGANPAYVMTWKKMTVEMNPELPVMPFIEQWDSDLKAMQAMSLDAYKQAACDILLKASVDDLVAETAKTPEALYDAYCTYEKNRQFAERYVTPAMTERTRQICMELKQTFADRLSRNTWIDAGSKANALEKLDAMEFYIGQPEFWIEEAMPDLSASQSLTDDLFRLSKARNYLAIWQIGKPHRGNAFVNLIFNNSMNVYDLNAGYMPTFNAMMIMPALMMEPVMPGGVNDAIVYATATVFGHEMTHGFDNKGAGFDKDGDNKSILVDPTGQEGFKQLSKRLADCYSTLEVMPGALPGICNDGPTTLGENIADLGGFEIAFEAYVNHLKRQGFTGSQMRLQQQRFYLAYAHLWQARYSAPYALERTVGTDGSLKGKDTHSLERERINGVVMNTDAWYDLFDIRPGDKLYRAPEDRVHIW